MAYTIVSDLIHSSFRLIGAIAAGEILETNELNDALVSLNQMIASWNTEGASLVGRQRMTMPVYQANTYPLMFQPIRIVAASVNSGGIDSPLEIVDAAGWESTPEKQALSVYVQKLYCDYLYPTSTVYIAPQPRLSGTLEFFYYSQIPLFVTLNDTITLPPGYEVALRYNFAVALLPEYPRSQSDPSLPAQAQMFKASIVQLNVGNQMRSQTQSPAQAAVDQPASSTASG
jgi:hypothetical protein